MFGLGWMELVIILAIVVLLFGAGRITGVMKDLGKGVVAFKSGLKDGEEVPAKPKKNKKK